MPTNAHRHAWVVSADMGYGHDRAAHGLEEIAYGTFIESNNYKGIPALDRKLWKETRELYETLSRFKPIPVIGDLIFSTLDRFQEIPPFYPHRDLSKPNVQLKGMYALVKRGLMKHLATQLMEKRRMPVICTFPLCAHAFESHGYPEDIYTLVTDTDMSRAWVAFDPQRSKIKYLAPTGRVVERLKLYGVRSENIYLTGFPIPRSIIGGTNSPILKRDLARRIHNLDPKRIFIPRYRHTLEAELGVRMNMKPDREPKPVTITFSVGGAGAQRQLALQIAKALREKIRRHEIRLILVAGTHRSLAHYFSLHLSAMGLGPSARNGTHVFYEGDRHAYFEKFDQILRKTDILWTKPSELSFYTGAGIPIIIAPPIGSQEEFNELWIQNVGGGIRMYDADTCAEWLQDWINSGALARMAWNGYIEAPTHGSYRIESVVTGEKVKLEQLPLIV